MQPRTRMIEMRAVRAMSLAFALASIAWIAPETTPEPPNILLFILDDVGIDQMEVFGYGGVTPPQLPNINAVANSGVRFRNFWAMPECSPSRALVFEGRYPMRTNVQDAILSTDLANSQVSPYETTTPEILRRRGYESGLFGKFHLTGSNADAAATANNPLGYTAPHELGWDFFAGWQDGAPHAIDPSAGGIDPGGGYACGFVPDATSINGADTGACYFVDGTCEEITSAQAATPGRACLERGGIFDPVAACKSPAPANLDFTLQNAYYAGELVINRPDGSFSVIAPEDPSGLARGYRSTLESNWAIDWITSLPAGKPWMATVSYSSAHTPYQQPPTSLLPPGSVPTSGFDCLTSVPDQRVLSNQMIEAMDAEIGRVLVEAGIATWRNGALHYDPEHSDTMVVIVGDNGTYAPVVKGPFNAQLSKGSVYQTGVWAPLIVAGPLVKWPGRDVGAMVNAADLFELFGEMAGIDVHRVVPKSRPLDSVSMLPYLQKRNQRSLRKTNFAQTASNIQAVGDVSPPCYIPAAATCVQLFTSQQDCTSEGGVWWGEADGSDPPLPIGAGAPQPDCCRVNQYLLEHGQPTYVVDADSQLAMRNDDYKLVRITKTDWDPTSSSCAQKVTTKFYEIDESPVLPKLDNPQADLLAPPNVLSEAEEQALRRLTRSLDALLATNVSCVGDGNLDGVVDQEDLRQFRHWARITGSRSSWYDFNLDGLTDENDVPYIRQQGQFPRKCSKPPSDLTMPPEVPSESRPR